MIEDQGRDIGFIPVSDVSPVATTSRSCLDGVETAEAEFLTLI